MSCTAGITAEEVCLLAHNPYDAGQRALWHLDSIGRLLDCSRKDAAGSSDLELLYAVPGKSRQPFSIAGSPKFPHSQSSEEFGFFGDALSPMSKTPSLPDFSGESQCKFLRITDKSRIRFFTKTSVCVFSLDLSPSMNVVDTSFKSVTTGCHLVDSLVRALEVSLQCLLLGPTGFKPDMLITVVAHGVPELGLFPLSVGERLASEADIARIICNVSATIKDGIQRLSKWLQANYVTEQLAGPSSCSRTRNPCTSLVCQANDVSTIVRNCLTALSMTCAQQGLSKSGVCKSILVVTDGVLAHPRKLPYDNALMHLNFVDVALHIVQVGGGFAPWSALGYASDPDLLRLLAASTPTGLFVQEHHLETKPGNALWVACTCKFSPLTKRGHTPYKSASYQSSMMLTGSPRGRLAASYVSLMNEEARMHAIKLQGIDEHEADGRDSRLGSSSSGGNMSPIFLANRRASSSDSLVQLGFGSPDSESSESDLDENVGSPQANVPMSLKAYMRPEKAKARPFLYKQYKLPRGVSAAQLIQMRVREGFVVDSVSKTKSNKVAGGLSRVASISGSTAMNSTSTNRLARTASSGAISSPGPNGEMAEQISLSAHWGPVIDIIYEVSLADQSEDDQLLIKIYLRMPSGEFFLRFKQQVASQMTGQDTNLYQMCRQLDGFIETVFQVDDTMAKLIVEESRTIPREVSLWHRWFTVRAIFCLIGTPVPQPRVRHGMLDPLLRVGIEKLVNEIRALDESVVELEQGKRFLCRQMPGTKGECHVKNALYRSNESVLSIRSSTRSHTDFFSVVTDTAVSTAPFYIIEVNRADTGIVRLNMAFFSCCPELEQRIVDSLSTKISASIISAPSPAIRAVHAGLVLPAAVAKKASKRSVAIQQRRGSEAVGMGGESFYTFDPDTEAVNRFMLHHQWEVTCPPASLVSDVITTIHERRLKEGWKCVYESGNAAVYVNFAAAPANETVKDELRSTVGIGKMVWTPDQAEELSAPLPAELKKTEIDWEKLLKKRVSVVVGGRRAISGSCVCLSVQHSQARGEKPILKCQLWADRGRSTWSTDAVEFREFCDKLCAFERSDKEVE